MQAGSTTASLAAGAAGGGVGAGADVACVSVMKRIGIIQGIESSSALDHQAGVQRVVLVVAARE
jgi:hypothetical protein